MNRLLFGLLAGAGAALLLAPRSGSELRDEIVTRSRDLKDSLLQRTREMLGEVESTNGSVRHSTVSGL